MSAKTTFNSQIRLATHNDVPSIINIMREVYIEHGLIFEVSQEIPDILDFERIYNQKSATFFVLLVKEEIIGTVGVKIIESSEAEIVRLYLKRNFRGLGFGYQLLKTAVNWAQKQGKNHIELWSFTQFTQGHSLYKKFGFTQLDTRQMNDVNKTQMYGFAFSS
ncbi:GNAT family N-acetyltransferase [Dendronalium sp. ChiSLP03b]|uniref:GNAT family N-acetyltransferase n=1 Tax=Dendronalium sp. ChiSLP03b TaxID=3075381 RepID=UPI002AD4CAF7|nr:GNAT family N-acetyltransferase [Dendronalium sp. ChiSLP03b]MDZ8206540.1 GNAT family N-acetyltransferase [Dendronalium sp. ChiSLP03b]